MTSFFDAYAGLAAAHRQALMGEYVVGLRAGGEPLGKCLAIVYQQRQDQPDLMTVGQTSESWSEKTREVEFTAENLRRAGLEPAVNQVALIDGEAWNVRRIVHRDDVATRIECSRPAQHRRAQHVAGGQR